MQVGDIVAEYHPVNDSFTHTILPLAAYLTDLKVRPLPLHTRTHTHIASHLHTNTVTQINYSFPVSYIFILVIFNQVCDVVLCAAHRK